MNTNIKTVNSVGLLVVLFCAIFSGIFSVKNYSAFNTHYLSIYAYILLIIPTFIYALVRGYQTINDNIIRPPFFRILGIIVNFLLLYPWFMAFLTIDFMLSGAISEIKKGFEIGLQIFLGNLIVSVFFGFIVFYISRNTYRKKL